MGVGVLSAYRGDLAHLLKPICAHRSQNSSRSYGRYRARRRRSAEIVFSYLLQGWQIYSDPTLAIFTMGVCTSDRMAQQPEHLATQTLHVALAKRAEQGNMERSKAAIVSSAGRSGGGHVHYKFANPVQDASRFCIQP